MPEVSRRIAFVGATVTRFTETVSVFNLSEEPDPNAPKSESRWITTLGGNPLITPLLLGHLGAIIEPHEVKVHDAAYLIPLVLSGGIVVDFDGNPLRVLEAGFNGWSRQNRMIGPFIASVSQRAVDELLSIKDGQTATKRGDISASPASL
jgi:hypothetical protein